MKTKRADYKTKEIECDKCGYISKVAAHIPLRLAWCPQCKSSKIRLYRRDCTMKKKIKPFTCEKCGDKTPWVWIRTSKKYKVYQCLYCKTKGKAPTK